jgi:hypothetical protein
MPDEQYSNEISNHPQPDSGANRPIIYQIRLEGQLGPQWGDWFGGLTITLEEDGHTLLTGPVLDQAALHGLLKRVRDLGMTLFSVNRLEAGQADAKQKDGA